MWVGLSAFALILIILVGRQFSPADHDSGSSTRNAPVTRTAPGTSSVGKPSRAVAPNGQDHHD